MVPQMIANRRGFGFCLAALPLLLAATPTLAQDAGPFAGFTGAWAGGGDIVMTDGSKERIRCRANYSVPPSGEALHIDLNCASDSYKVRVISNAVASGGSLSGTWRETTRQAEGTISGRIPGPGQIQASLEGTAYGIQMSVNTRGSQQSVAIQAQGTDVQSVRIQMKKN